MEINHGKHHQAYIDNLNKALEKAPALKGKTIEQIVSDLNSAPAEVRPAIRNHGGGHYNHSLFWKVMSPSGGGRPTGDLLDKIDSSFGSFEAFQEKFSQAAITRFGSGWGWLSVDGKGGLVVHSTANQDSPLMEGLKPMINQHKCLLRKTRYFLAVDTRTFLLDKKKPRGEDVGGLF
jgi:Fe-Mn family superoxide dismutase